MSNTDPTARQFIVGPSGDDAIIREVADGKSHLDRPTAWARALRMAWPVKTGRVKGVGSVFFLGLDGDRREVATPGDVQAHWLANRLNNPVAPAAQDRPNPVEPAASAATDEPSPERVAAVVTALREQAPNDFRDSLLSYFDRKGRLSLKQVEAVEKGIAKRAANAPAPEAPSVPAGRYAVENEEGTLAFYVVDHGKGRWEGYTFVSVMASDEEHRIRGRAARDAILAKIAADPKAASARYGHKIGSCGLCGKTLTREDSRTAGIGPICAQKAGW